MTESNEPEIVFEAPEETPEAEIQIVDLLSDSDPEPALYRFKRSGPNWDLDLLDYEIDNGRRDLQHYRNAISSAVAEIPNDKRSPRLAEFHKSYENDNILEMPILNESVEKGDRDGSVRDHRTKLRQILNSIPDL